MFEQMLSSFLGSEQGRGARQVLEQRGIPQGQIQQILSAALPAAATSLDQQGNKASPGQPALGMFDMLGGHPGQAFLIGAATSMLRGEGMSGAVRDGAASIVGAHIGEVLASRTGMDRQMASGVSAAITPFIVSFVQEHLAGHPDVVAQRGNTPEGQQKFDTFAAQKEAARGAGGGGGKGQPAQGGFAQKGQPQGLGGDGQSPGSYSQKPMGSEQGGHPQESTQPGFQQGSSQKPTQQGFEQQGGYPQKPMQGSEQGGYPQKPMQGSEQGGYPQKPMQQGGYPEKPMAPGGYNKGQQKN